MWLRRAYSFSYGSLTKTINNKWGQKWLVLTSQITQLYIFITANGPMNQEMTGDAETGYELSAHKRHS